MRILPFGVGFLQVVQAKKDTCFDMQTSVIGVNYTSVRWAQLYAQPPSTVNVNFIHRAQKRKFHFWPPCKHRVRHHIKLINKHT